MMRIFTPLALVAVLNIAVNFLPSLQPQAALDFTLGPKEEFFRVDEIQVVGNRKVEAEAVLRKLSIKKGDFVDNYQIRHDLENIYKLKYFNHIEVQQLRERGKNILVFKVEERSLVKK